MALTEAQGCNFPQPLSTVWITPPASVIASGGTTVCHAGAVQWSVPIRYILLSVGGAGVFGIAAALADDGVSAVVAVAAAVTLLAIAGRDAIVHVRLAADADGLTVIRGYAGRRRIPWSEVAAIRVDRRSRLGLSSHLLEVDTGETVHLLTARELGADPADVAAALQQIRR